VAQPFSQPVSAAVPAAAAAASSGAAAALSTLLAAIWLVGCALILLTWCVRWRRVHAAVRQGTPVGDGRALAALRRLEQRGGIRTPIALISSDSALEPGVFGILSPVLLWPRRIADRLGDEQVEAILAHELSHVRRRDNLAAALHMTVQALFWFHPLVWWLGARLVDERERACDDEAIRLGSEPRVYAESLLKTCELFVESRLACVSGVTGSDLKRRIEAIMSHDAERALSTWRKVLLASAVAAVIVAPVGVGALQAPHLRLQAPPAASDKLTFEVASIKPNRSGDGRVEIFGEPGGRFTATNITPAVLIRQAYRLRGAPFAGSGSDSLIAGAPAWVYSDRFDIVAKADTKAPANQMSAMVRSLLAERFKLQAHLESREQLVYALVLARNDGQLGPRFRQSAVDCATLAAARGRGPTLDGGSGGGARGASGSQGPAPLAPGERPPCGLRIGPGNMIGGGVMLAQLTNTLSPFVQRIVLDRTGLNGGFDIDLRWTPDVRGRGASPEGPPTIDPDTPSIFTAVQEQLGLRLESTTGQVDVLVIDHVEPPAED
jgi:uncharacterized protein (TIGR03435 family)